MVEYGVTSIQVRRNRLRLAALWPKTIPELQKMLDCLGAPYPTVNLFVDEEDYRLRLIEMVIEYEPRLV
jgi:hypothetical protein